MRERTSSHLLHLNLPLSTEKASPLQLISQCPPRMKIQPPFHNPFVRYDRKRIMKRELYVHVRRVLRYELQRRSLLRLELTEAHRNGLHTFVISITRR